MKTYIRHGKMAFLRDTFARAEKNVRKQFIDHGDLIRNIYIVRPRNTVSV